MDGIINLNDLINQYGAKRERVSARDRVDAVEVNASGLVVLNGGINDAVNEFIKRADADGNMCAWSYNSAYLTLVVSTDANIDTLCDGGLFTRVKWNMGRHAVKVNANITDAIYTALEDTHAVADARGRVVGVKVANSQEDADTLLIAVAVNGTDEIADADTNTDTNTDEIAE